MPITSHLNNLKIERESPRLVDLKREELVRSEKNIGEPVNLEKENRAS